MPGGGLSVEGLSKNKRTHGHSSDREGLGGGQRACKGDIIGYEKIQLNAKKKVKIFIHKVKNCVENLEDLNKCGGIPCL